VARICSVKNCKNVHGAKGYCSPHYKRLMRYGDPLHIPSPEETRKKQSESHKGQRRSVSEETKKKMSVIMKGKVPWNKGKTGVYSEASIKKMKGRVVSEETKKQMSAYAKNRTIEHKMKIVKARKDYKHSEKTKKKISLAKKGEKRSEEQVKKMSETTKKWFENNIHPMKGKKLSKERVKQMSESMKGELNHFFGEKHSKETRKKISEINKIIQNKPEMIEASKKSRSKQKFPFRDSKPELLTQSILEKNNIGFIKHKIFKLSNSYHQADITIEPNKVIEVNGDYWHYNPKQYDGELIVKQRRKKVKVKEVWEHDKKIIDGMKQQGYKVLIIWEGELKKELDKTTKKILKFAKS